MNVTKLDYYSLRPLYIQTAVDKKWDQSWKIPVNSSLPSTNKIKDFVKKGEKLAFEMFYETTYGGRLLFGAYYTEKINATSKEEFLKIAINIFLDEQNTQPSKAVAQLNKKLSPGNKFLLGLPDAVLLGILDFWRFYAPCALDIHKNYNLENQLEKYPHLKMNKDNTALLEFVYEKNILHFIGFTASKKSGGQFGLNFPLVNELITNLGNNWLRRDGSHNLDLNGRAGFLLS